MEKKKGSILIVDDNEISLRALRGHLSRNGYQVFSTTDPQEGLIAALTLPIDACVFDGIMPNMSGAMLCAKIKDEIPDLPIIIYSGSLWPEDKLLARVAGADDFIIKDGAMDDLTRCIVRLLR